ncbi:hypothetical protein B0H14DRAFT_3738556 [Mycena olivaceomarginata]|nr:hypothetical protein B0H14DRAFT_3738556 [Mycena olivaceomarginata]
MGKGYVFDAPPLHVAHPPYAAATASAYLFVASSAAPHLTLSHQHQHSHSQSLSYKQNNSHSHNRGHSCSQSQAQFEYHGSVMGGCGELGAHNEMVDMRWGAAPVHAAHYGYPVPAFGAACPAQNLSRSVLSRLVSHLAPHPIHPNRSLYLSISIILWPTDPLTNTDATGGTAAGAQMID